MTTLEKAARAPMPDAVGRAIVAFIGALPSDKDPRNCFDYEWQAAMTAALSSVLLDPSDEVVRDAAQKLKPWAFARAEDMTDADWELCESERRSACNTARACLRAAGVKITGSQG